MSPPICCVLGFFSMSLPYLGLRIAFSLGLLGGTNLKPIKSYVNSRK